MVQAERGALSLLPIGMMEDIPPRNICIIAHVDHGKTTVADSLLASNGIVSTRMAGLGLRYMDSREDEQNRGITMKASAIALAYQADGGVRHPVNLIDSPGHVDFSSEVSAAVRLADGALVVVDVVEGVCVQTHAVLRQAWEESVTPVLVLNKVDRLVTELQFSPHEAWEHIKKVVQTVNAITGHLYTGSVLESVAESFMGASAAADGTDGAGGDTVQAVEDSVNEVQFAPEKGNVVFASAMHGWAFDLRVFAKLYAQKLGVREELLQQTLWGEYFYQPKTKRIMRTSAGGKLKPMFVQFVLQTVWQVYQAAFVDPDDALCAKIVDRLELHVPPHELHHADPLVKLRGIMGQWLPLGRNLLRVVTEQLPTAAQAQHRRLQQLCPELHAAAVLPKEGPPSGPSVEGANDTRADRPHAGVTTPVGASADASHSADAGNPPVVQAGDGVAGRADGSAAPSDPQISRAAAMSNLRQGIIHCDADAPLIVYVAKVVCANGVPGAHPDDAFVGFVRVFSGTLHPEAGGALHICRAETVGTQSSSPLERVERVELQSVRLYVLMGRELVPTGRAVAGMICGIGGLGSALFKGATLSSEPSCPPLARMAFEGDPIVQVALEPEQLSCLPQLERGLHMLALADPTVEVAQLETGEHVLRTCGEVHLERCLHDLRTTFAPGVALVVSPPIVPVLESVASDACGRATSSLASKQAALTMRAQALPHALAAALSEHRAALRSALHAGRSWLANDSAALHQPLQCLQLALSEQGSPWADLKPLGAAPFDTCANILLCPREVEFVLQNDKGSLLQAYHQQHMHTSRSPCTRPAALRAWEPHRTMSQPPRPPNTQHAQVATRRLSAISTHRSSPSLTGWYLVWLPACIGQRASL